MRGSTGLPTPAVATFAGHRMSTAPTTAARLAGAPQPSAAGAAPPHSIEAEQSVLGAMLLSDRTHYAFVIEEGLKVEDFYRERHREVYESMLALFTAGESIDVLTVTEHLRSTRPAVRRRSMPSPPRSPPSATCASTPRSSATARCCAAC
jgi:DnaB-like helicase N terminal domain